VKMIPFPPAAGKVPSRPLVPSSSSHDSPQSNDSRRASCQPCFRLNVSVSRLYVGFSPGASQVEPSHTRAEKPSSSIKFCLHKRSWRSVSNCPTTNVNVTSHGTFAPGAPCLVRRGSIIHAPRISAGPRLKYSTYPNTSLRQRARHREWHTCAIYQISRSYSTM
jgi:hypothetical protein